MSDNIKVKVLMLKGQDGKGISSIKKTSTSGLVDTYTITFTDGTTSTFTVTNGKGGGSGSGSGNGISSIKKTGTSGLVDTYTIMMTDGTKSTFTVTNGAKGDKGDTGSQGQQGVKGQDGVSISNVEKKSTSGLTDTYEITLTDGTKKSFTVTNGKGIKSIAKTSTSGLTDTYTITYNDGTTSTFTVKNGNSVGDMDYELTKPKLIVDYTVTEQKKEYEFTTADYPDLAKCKWIYMSVNAPSKPTNQPWVVVKINNSTVYGISVSNIYNIVEVQKLNGLWRACGMGTDNVSQTNSNVGISMFWPTGLSNMVVYSPIERISLSSYTMCLLENTQIKVYGHY